MDADFICQALRARHPAREWLLLREVRTRRGYSPVHRGIGRKRKRDDALIIPANFDGERYIDLFAFNMFPSSGHRRISYEIKVARQDYLDELANPAKRAHAYFFSHEFWFAVAPGVWRPDDPWDFSSGCGLLEIQEDGSMRKIYSALRRDAWPLPDTFIVSLLDAALHANPHYLQALAGAEAMERAHPLIMIGGDPQQIDLARLLQSSP